MVNTSYSSFRRVGWRSSSGPVAIVIAPGVPFQFDNAATLNGATLAERDATLTLVELDGGFELGLGRLQTTPQSTPAWQELGFYGDGLIAAAGVCLVVQYEWEQEVATGFGFKTEQEVDFTQAEGDRWAFYASSSTSLQVAEKGSVFFEVVGSHPENTVHTHALIVLDDLAVVYIRNAKVLWISEETLPTTVYPVFGHNGGDGDILAFVPTTVTNPEDALVLDAIASGVLTGTETFTHPMNFVLTVGINALGAAGIALVDFRYTDNDNRWSVVVNSDGDVSLDERVAGVKTTRASGTVAAQAGDRVTVVLDDVSCTVYVGNAESLSYGGVVTLEGNDSGRVLSTQDVTVNDPVLYARDVPAVLWDELEGKIV